ncbi:hypothetical protein LX36DRAFT_659512 [Colletotrichum falcatum]|nr:hypothetical protein LX36DRAFT_659512 [Colletotrichum falcatum]
MQGRVATSCHPLHNRQLYNSASIAGCHWTRVPQRPRCSRLPTRSGSGYLARKSIDHAGTGSGGLLLSDICFVSCMALNGARRQRGGWSIGCAAAEADVASRSGVW